MARAGIGPIIADRVSNNRPPPPPPPPPRLTPNQADRQSQAAIIARDQAASLAAFRASGLGAAGFISMTDSRAATPPPPPKPPTKPPTPPPKPPTKPPTPPPTVTETPVIEPILPAVEPTPIAIPEVMTQPEVPPVKSAPIDTVVFIDEAFSSELITDLLFEDIAGQELLSIARNDTVNGQAVTYQPIKNLGILRDTYNPNNLLKLQDTSDRFFANFIINLFDKIPQVGNGENGANYYLDLTSGDGIIELINIRADEQVEVQIANAGTIEDVGI
jgi:hypothetical protein